MVRITPKIEISFIASKVLFERTNHVSKNQSRTRDDHHLG